MKTQRMQWIRIKIERDTLRELTKRSDTKGFIQVLLQLFMTLILGITSYICFKSQPLWVSMPVFYLYATVYSFSGYTAAIHELSHNTVFKTKWLNEFFIRIFSIMSWSDYVYFRVSHAQHHAYTTNETFDKEVRLPMNVTVIRLLQKFTIDFEKIYDEFNGIIGIFRRAFGIIKEGREQELFGSNEKLRMKMIRWNRWMISIHLIILIGIILSKEWLLLLLITSTIFFGQWYNALVSLTQHAGLASNVTDFRKNCRSIKLSSIGGFLYWQMHYHIEHHMYGGVPFYNLSKLSKVLLPHLPERKSLFGAWVEIIDASKRQKSNPEYFIQVEFPK